MKLLSEIMAKRGLAYFVAEIGMTLIQPSIECSQRSISRLLFRTSLLLKYRRQEIEYQCRPQCYRGRLVGRYKSDETRLPAHW
jgi:hypothetical protein